MQRRDDARRTALAQAARVMGAALGWVASTALFAFAGYWADGRFGTRPWLTLIGGLVGGVAGFYSLLRQVSSPPETTE